jgi:hypothetical protein
MGSGASKAGSSVAATEHRARRKSFISEDDEEASVSGQNTRFLVLQKGVTVDGPVDSKYKGNDLCFMCRKKHATELHAGEPTCATCAARGREKQDAKQAKLDFKAAVMAQKAADKLQARRIDRNGAIVQHDADSDSGLTLEQLAVGMAVQVASVSFGGWTWSYVSEVNPGARRSARKMRVRC